MKISYKKKHLYVNLGLGLFWLFYFILNVFFNENPNWLDYGWIVISLVYLGLYYYQKKYKYVIIDNGIIMLDGPLGKKLYLKDINRIKKFAGDYILKTGDKDLAINTQIIAPDSLAQLNAELEKLDVEWI